MKKLIVPGPDSPDAAPGTFDKALKIAFFLCVLVMGATGYYLTVARPALDARAPSPEEQKQLAIERAIQSRVQHLAELTSTELHNFSWNEADLTLAIERGPNRLSEAACEAIAQTQWPSLLHSSAGEALHSVLTQRYAHAPWACVSRLYFAGQLTVHSSIFEAAKSFWNDVQTFSGNDTEVVDMLEEFRRTRKRPDSEQFYSWLRRCALQWQYLPNEACLQLLHQISPLQGEDILMMIHTHLQQASANEDDVTLIIEALGQLGQHGQPLAWRILETRHMPDYDVDFRQGVVFSLCRFVNAPEEFVATRAANQLSRIAGFGARQLDDSLLSRWQKGCQIAFEQPSDLIDNQPGTEVHGEPDNAGSASTYSLFALIERGECSVFEGKPRWYCGAKMWKEQRKPLRVALMETFTKTRSVQWH